MFLLIIVFFFTVTYLMISSNPHDYQVKQYNKLYTLSFIPKEFRIKANYYTKDIANQYPYPYILKPYI